MHIAADSTMSDMGCAAENMQHGVEDALSYENYRMADKNFNQVTSTTQQILMNQQTQHQNRRRSHEPAIMCNNLNSFMHPHNTNIPEPTIVENDENFDMTLQWRNSHFRQKSVEPDSTADKNIEDIMIQGLTGLTTETCESRMSRPPTNMVLNTMDTLLTSFVEENKYFENQTFNRYQ